VTLGKILSQYVTLRSDYTMLKGLNKWNERFVKYRKNFLLVKSRISKQLIKKQEIFGLIGGKYLLLNTFEWKINHMNFQY
jgi:hypothetical protein